MCACSVMLHIPGAPASCRKGQCIIHSSASTGQGSASVTSPCPRTTRSFVGFAEDESDRLRTHCHFEVFFAPDNRKVRWDFLVALEEMFSIGDDLVMSEAPDAEYLLSIPDKEHNRGVIEYLQIPDGRELANIHFNSVPADEDIAFIKSSAYDAHDTIATTHALVELRNVPLHLRTIKTVKRLLQPYCAVTELYPHQDNSVDRTCFRCFCWTDTTASIPSRIMIKIRRRLRSAIAGLGQIALDTFIVLIRAVHNPLMKSLCPFQELPPQPDLCHTNFDEDIPQCFLQDTEVDEYEFRLLTRSLVLSQVDGSPPIDVRTLSAAIKQQLPQNRCLKVHQIAFGAFIVHCYNFSPFQAFKCDAVDKGRIMLADQLFNASAWSTAYGSTEMCIGRFVRIDLNARTRGLLQRSIVDHILSSYVLLENGYADDQILVDGDEYTVFGWIHSSIYIPENINIYMTPNGCHSSYGDGGRTYLSLYERHMSLAIKPAYIREG